MKNLLKSIAAGLITFTVIMCGLLPLKWTFGIVLMCMLILITANIVGEEKHD